MARQCKMPLIRTEGWLMRFDTACFLRLSPSKALIGTYQSGQDLKTLYRSVDLNRLTHLYFQVLNEQFQDTHLMKLLKKAKNLRHLTLRFGYMAERFELKALFRVVGLLKLESLTIVYKQYSSENTSNFLYELWRLLGKLSTIKSLKLKFQNIVFHEEFNSIISRFSCYNLTMLELSFKDISSSIDTWIVPFSRAIGKALYRNLADPKIISLSIAEKRCEGLTPSGISKFLASFDKIHLTNYISLRHKADYNDSENGVNFHYKYGDLFLMFLKRQAKFKLNSLELSTADLSQSCQGFTKKKQNLSMNSLHLNIHDDWKTKRLRETMECVKLFQPKKELKMVFPFSVRYQREDDPYYNAYDYEEEESQEEEEQEEDEGHVFDIVLRPMLSKISKNMSICLDFAESVFDEQDYDFLKDILESAHKPITFLNLILPAQNIENDYYPDMTETEMLAAMISLVCSMYNVTTCAVDINQLKLEFYEGDHELEKEFKINQHSSLEKLILDVSQTHLKPKIIHRILKIFKELPKLKSVEIICSETVYQACKSIESLKSRESGKIVLCKFLQKERSL